MLNFNPAENPMAPVRAYARFIQAVSSDLSPDSILKTASSQVCTVFGLDYAWIYLFDATQKRVLLIEKSGTSPYVPADSIGLGSNSPLEPIARTVLDREPSVMPDAGGSQVGVPILVGQHAEGAMVVGTDSAPDNITPEVLELLQSVANYIGLMHRHVQFDNTSRLLGFIKQIVSIRDPEDMLRALQEQTAPRSSFLSLMYYQLDAEGNSKAQSIAHWSANGNHFENFVDGANADSIDEILVFQDVSSTSDDALPLIRYLRDSVQAKKAMIIPLQSRLESNGALLIGFDDVNINGALEEMFRTLAPPLDLALNNFLATDILERQMTRFSTISEMSQVVLGALDLNTLNQAIPEALDHFLDVNYISLALIESGSSQVEIVGIRGATETRLQTLSGTYIQQAMADNQVIILHGEDEHKMGNTGWLPTKSELILLVPMTGRAELVGTLNIGLTTPTISAEDVNLCEQIAVLASITIENIRLLSRLQGSLEETNVLYNIAMTMNSAEGVQDIYEMTLMEMAQLSHANELRLYMVGPDPRTEVVYVDEMAAWASKRVVQFDHDGDRFEVAEAPVIADFVLSQVNIVINDIANDKRLSDKARQALDGRGATSLMILPLSVGNVWLGCVLVQGHENQYFTTDQSRLCRSVADQAALALDSHMLLQRTREIAAREQALREITERIRNARDVDEVMKVAAGHMSGVLDISSESFEYMSRHTSQRHRLDPNQRELIDTVASQVSMAVENLNLLENAQRSALRQEIVNELTARLQRSTTVENVMETTVRTLREVLSEYDITLRLTPSALANMGRRSKTGPLVSPEEE